MKRQQVFCQQHRNHVVSAQLYRATDPAEGQGKRLLMGVLTTLVPQGNKQQNEFVVVLKKLQTGPKYLILSIPVDNAVLVLGLERPPE